MWETKLSKRNKGDQPKMYMKEPTIDLSYTVSMWNHKKKLKFKSKSKLSPKSSI